MEYAALVLEISGSHHPLFLSKSVVAIENLYDPSQCSRLPGSPEGNVSVSRRFPVGQHQFHHDPEEVYDEDPEEDYRETYGDIYPYDWYEDYLMDVRDEIDADPRETCVKLIRYLLENQVDGCIDWGHIDFQ